LKLKEFVRVKFSRKNLRAKKPIEIALEMIALEKLET